MIELIPISGVAIAAIALFWHNKRYLRKEQKKTAFINVQIKRFYKQVAKVLNSRYTSPLKLADLRVMI